MPSRARPDRQIERRDEGLGGERHLLAAGGTGGAVGGDLGVPSVSAGDDSMQLSQDRRCDHGLGLGRGELVRLPDGLMLIAGGVDGVATLRAPDGPPRGQTQSGSALAGELGSPTNVPDSFSRGARPACLTEARAVANRFRSSVSARIAAAPTAGGLVIDVTSSVSLSSSRTSVIRVSVSMSLSAALCQSCSRNATRSKAPVGDRLASIRRATPPRPTRPCPGHAPTPAAATAPARPTSGQHAIRSRPIDHPGGRGRCARSGWTCRPTPATPRAADVARRLEQKSTVDV